MMNFVSYMWLHEITKVGTKKSVGTIGTSNFVDLYQNTDDDDSQRQIDEYI